MTMGEQDIQKAIQRARIEVAKAKGVFAYPRIVPSIRQQGRRVRHAIFAAKGIASFARWAGLGLVRGDE